MSIKRPQGDPMAATRSTLLRRVRDLNDADGWEEFNRLYRPLLVEYAGRRKLPLDAAEEIAQQCLTAIVSRIGQFEKQSSFRGWLRGMVDHKISDYFAHRRRERQADTDVLLNVCDTGPSPVELWELSWNQVHLRHLIASLRASFAKHTLQAFSLYVLEERPVKEISQALGMTPNQIYVAKARITRCIRERFSDVVDGLYGVSV